MDEAVAYLEFMGADMEVIVTYEVTDWGSPPIIDYANGGEPGWGPEFDIERIVMRVERFGKSGWESGPEFEATGALFEFLASCERIHDAVISEFEENYSEHWGYRKSRRCA